ncbi:MAG: hypothetical protein LBN32_04590, partial [Helicobacteraceae bacterium]|nr:hypothetical protein [Helicobacteraceae bacterium]
MAGAARMNVNRLILGDNLEILKGFDSECVDLIYLDPFYCSLGEKYTNDFYKYDDGDAKGLYRLGDIIAFSFNKGAIEESARLKNKENLVIKLVTVEEIVPIATKPTVSVLFEEIQRHPHGDRAIRLTATGRSEAGIEFYSWDFKHDAEKGFSPSVMIDKEG